MAEQTVLTGKFLGASKTETVGQKNFTIRKFWMDITTNPEWPNTPEFKLKGDKVNLVDNLQQGQTIQVKFNVEGRKFDNTANGGRKGVITELVAWKIDVIQMQSAAVAPAPAPARTPSPAPAPAAFAHAGDAEGDDLPF